MYAFFKPTPEIIYEQNRRAHVFSCAAKNCKKTFKRFLDGTDASSTGNLRRHVHKCWGPEILKQAETAASIDEAREKIVGSMLRDGVITQSFKRKAGGTVTFSHRTHTRAETRYVQFFGASPLLKYYVRTEIVRWVTESMRPYAVVKDRGFLSLMKTGRPGYWVPSPSTVIRDTRFVYDRTREKLARVLQEYEGDVSLATDAWSSPNHRAFMAITVHFVYKEEPISLLLDVVEVPEVCVPDYGWMALHK